MDYYDAIEAAKTEFRRRWPDFNARYRSGSNLSPEELRRFHRDLDEIFKQYDLDSQQRNAVMNELCMQARGERPLRYVLKDCWNKWRVEKEWGFWKWLGATLLFCFLSLLIHIFSGGNRT